MLFKRLFGSGRSTDDGDDERGGEEFRWCPSCGDEYRPEFTTCAHCGGALVAAGDRRIAEREKGGSPPRPEALSPGDDLIAVRQGTLLDLKQLRNVLAGASIASLLAGDGPECTKGCRGSASFLLLVRQQDVEAAQRVLAEEFRRTTGLDRPGEDVPDGDRCPSCGSMLRQELEHCPDCGLFFQLPRL